MAAPTKKRISYFYDAEVGNYHYGQGHPMKVRGTGVGGLRARAGGVCGAEAEARRPFLSPSCRRWRLTD